MLTALAGYSQEDTVKLPFSVARQIALDLEELDGLRQLERVNSLELAKYERLTADLEQVVTDRGLQLNLLKENLKSLQVQLGSEKAKKPKKNTLSWIFRCAGVFAVGYLVGNIAN